MQCQPSALCMNKQVYRAYQLTEDICTGGPLHIDKAVQSKRLYLQVHIAETRLS